MSESQTHHQTSTQKIFVGGLSPQTTQESLQKYFQVYGEVKDCILMSDRETGKSRGFGFVTMQDPDITQVILNLEHYLDQKRIECKLAFPREKNKNQEQVPVERTNKLFVGGLPQNIDEEEFRAYFSGFGDIKDSVVMYDRGTNRPRGFGFITFESEDSVDLVLQNFDNNYISGKWVECKKATPKDNQENDMYDYHPAYPAYPNYPVMDYPQYQNQFYEEYEEPQFVLEPSQINPFAEGFVLNEEDKANILNNSEVQ